MDSTHPTSLTLSANAVTAAKLSARPETLRVSKISSKIQGIHFLLEPEKKPYNIANTMSPGTVLAPSIANNSAPDKKADGTVAAYVYVGCQFGFETYARTIHHSDIFRNKVGNDSSSEG